jgi:hypothetical protein
MGNTNKPTFTVTLVELEFEPRSCWCSDNVVIRGVTADHVMYEFIWSIGTLPINKITGNAAGVITFSSYVENGHYIVVEPTDFRLTKL